MIEHTKFPLGDDDESRRERGKILMPEGRALMVYSGRGGFYRVEPPEDGVCAKKVRSGSFSSSQCSRKATVEEFGFGWCRQHAPSLVKGRQKARADERRAEFERRAEKQRKRDAERDLERRAVEALRVIAKGDLNDPAGYAQMVLDGEAPQP